MSDVNPPNVGLELNILINYKTNLQWIVKMSQ